MLQTLIQAICGGYDRGRADIMTLYVNLAALVTYLYYDMHMTRALEVHLILWLPETLELDLTVQTLTLHRLCTPLCYSLQDELTEGILLRSIIIIIYLYGLRSSWFN